MRIRNSGSGFSGFGKDSRSSSFRKGRRPGQKVLGKLLKWVSDDMAWVEIDGQKLLAKLQSSPPVGAHLTFIIKQLVPEIVLKEVFDSGATSVATLETAASFETSRTLFESRFRQYASPLSSLPGEQRPEAFVSLLGQDRKLLAAYMDVLNCARAITRQYGRAKGHTLLYQPWLFPEARRLATIFRSADDSGNSHLMAAIVEFETPGFGMARIEFLHKDTRTGYRLKLQHPDKGGPLKRYLDSRSTTAQCLGTEKLRQLEHGGILAELLFSK